MELVFVALPVALVIGGAALAAFIWAARDDQFEDLDTPPERALFEELPAVDGMPGREEGRSPVGRPVDADLASGDGARASSVAAGGESPSRSRASGA